MPEILDQFKDNNEDRRIEGNDLGIFLYFVSWLTVGMLFTFTTNIEIKNILDFYVRLDILAIAYVSLHFSYSKKRHSKPERDWLDFDAFKAADFFQGIMFAFILFGCLILINFLLVLTIPPPSGNLVDEYNFGTNLLLMLGRNIIVEELVFRGLLLMVCIYAFISFFKFPEKLSILFSILISGFVFGFYHYFKYGKDLRPLLYLSFLGIFCAWLALRYGVWAAIFLHAVNNLFSALSGLLSFSGCFDQFLNETIFSLTFILQIILYAFVFIIGFKIIKSFKGKSNLFGLFMLTLIVGFIFGFYTNGLIKGEPGGLYFQHYHAILIIPFVYFIFKKKLRNDILFSIVAGALLGLFISDYIDIINQTQLELAYSVFYTLISLQIFISIKLVFKEKKIQGVIKC